VKIKSNIHLNNVPLLVTWTPHATASLPLYIKPATIAKITSAQKIYMLNVIPSGCPLKKCIVTSKFGWRVHPITRDRKFHKGLDFKAKRRTDVFATADGVVEYVNDKDNGTFGRMVRISHNFGFKSIYAHLRFVKVSVGDVIKKGQLIAKSGNSGRSNGPHLHYEVRYASKVLNPKDFIRWNLKDYEKLFTIQRGVKWESLVKQIKKQNQIMLQQ
jgi:murein DD-endopeptidase MepM/ murein hydrolase activator NlpD